MKSNLWGLTALTIIALGSYLGKMSRVIAQQALYLAYPPNNHETTAEQIFFIGTASSDGEVLINDQLIKRSQGGHFAPSFPLKVGANQFILRYKKEKIKIIVNRVSTVTNISPGIAFLENSLFPKQNISRLLGEPVCFSAMAPPKAQVSVKINNLITPLFPEDITFYLPDNSAVFIDKNQPIKSNFTKYRGCISFAKIGQIGKPIFNFIVNKKNLSQLGSGTIEILSPNQLENIQVTADLGVARTGPSNDYSRLTPLPKGTIAGITGKQGDWLRLDYGGWIKENETRSLGISSPPKNLIKSIQSQVNEEAINREHPIFVIRQFNKVQAIREEASRIGLNVYPPSINSDI
ncbi:MAG TPA: N-acetylmuramoyl-L-alanine amidase, partial [Cyanothece sp. UBA12306]|nr:N-acetylmuramoyl-L-alanine amidase [Cyanothece sp. UBA12306]